MSNFNKTYIIDHDDIPNPPGKDIYEMIQEPHYEYSNGSYINLEFLNEEVQDIVVAMPDYPGDDETIYVRLSW